MNKVITINLNGRAYQLEEAGYDMLRSYLDEAGAKLKDNPDKAEIMADFEQAIADKCEGCLRGGRNVVAGDEVEAIIAKMGPVEGPRTAGEKAAGTGAGEGARAPKRLYRIREGEMLRGVCNGIAAYFNIDVTPVRALFVLLTIFTGGGWAVAYFILTFVMPVARTGDEIAEAHGEAPFTAQDFIDRAKMEYEKYKADPAGDRAAWRQHMREWKHEWRSEWREKRRAWREEWRKERDERRAERRMRSYHGGADAFVGLVASIMLFLLFVAALWSLIFHGAVFGHALGIGHPLWVSILFITAVFWLVSLPFRHLMHNSEGSFLALVAIIVFAWTAVILFPPVRDAWNSLIAWLATVRT